MEINDADKTSNEVVGLSGGVNASTLTNSPKNDASKLSFTEQMKLLPGLNFWLATISSSLTLSLFYTFSTVIG